jgi:hypothetical protein
MIIPLASRAVKSRVRSTLMATGRKGKVVKGEAGAFCPGLFMDLRRQGVYSGLGLDT